MLEYTTGEALVSSFSNINERVNYTANTGLAFINTANSSLSTGTASLLTGASNGTFVKYITIKATGTTSRGMVRLFLGDGETYTVLVGEFHIPEVTRSSKVDAFCRTYLVNIYVKASLILSVSTQNAEGFVVFAEGLDYSYP